MPTLNISIREFSKLRGFLENETLKKLGIILKKKKWRKNHNIFFLSHKNWFWELTVSTHWNIEKTSATLAIKPMSIDPILWDIMDLSENHKAPLSFRANGAFICSSLPIDNFIIEDSEKNAEVVSLAIYSWVVDSFDEYCNHITESTFSSKVEAHENQRERGAYAISLITSLISEGNIEKARKYAQAYESSDLVSISKMTNSDGKSFHYHSLKWLS